jgi:hypothetical protein
MYLGRHFPKKIYKWTTITRKDSQHQQLPANANQNHSEYYFNTYSEKYNLKLKSQALVA